MKKKIKMVSFLSLLMICLLSLHSSAYAKEKVTKVVSKSYRTSSTQYHVISGKTRKGKTVWKYKTSKCAATELRSASWKEKGSYVYIIDNKAFIRLNKQTGKVVAKKKIKSQYAVWGATMYIDGNSNVYSIGAYDSRLIKFTKNGKIQWTRNIPKYYWAYKIKASGRKLTVYFNGPKKGGRVVVDTRNGKILSRK